MSPRGGSKRCADNCQCGRHGKPKGAESPNWVGDDITHKAMHERVMLARGAARTHRCFFHAERGVTVAALDWAQINETAGLHIADYIPLCRKCHLRYDLTIGARTPARRRGAHLARSLEERTATALAGWATRRRAAALRADA